MRKRLIELLNAALDSAATSGVMVDNIADYLLDNGVILPPVRVGQTVWYLNTRWSMYMKRNAIYEAKINRVYISENNTLILSVLIKNEHGTTEHSGVKDIGKTVFLTYDEAEATLKAREKT